MPCKVQGSTSRQCHQVSTYNILIISMVTDFTTNTVAIIIIMNITIACQYQTQSCDDQALTGSRESRDPGIFN